MFIYTYKEILKQIKMASPHAFSVPGLEKKLKELNTTLQSIQSLSQWAIHHRKHAKTVVSVWYKDLQKANSSRKLTLLYLANDIIQNSKRKGQEYKTEFIRALPRAFQLVSKEKDDSLQKAVLRILAVWEERRVFEQDLLTKFKTIITHTYRRTRSESDVKRVPPPEPKRVKLDSPPPEEPPNNRTPPEAEDLLKRMLAIDADKSVAQDKATRQKIDDFPPEIHDPDLLSKIKDKPSVEALAGKVEEASKVLSEYNSRLEAELKERREIQELLDAFTWQQKELLRGAKKRLKEYQGKLERVTVVREELKSHLANLPDFSKLPMGSATSLAPLPTVGDLFN